MPKTGRPRTPREVKVRRGTLRKDRDGGAALIVLPAVARAEAPPADKSGLDFIQDVLDAGATAWIGATDLATLELARQLWEDRERARRIWLSELIPDENGLRADGKAIALHDEKLFNAYAKLTERLIQCLSALGLDPTARTRLGVAEVKRQTVLDQLQSKRATRKAGRHAG